MYGIELGDSVSILDMKFYGEHSGDAEFHGESQLLLLVKDELSKRYMIGSILYNNLTYSTIAGPTLQSNIAVKLNHLMEYIVKDCNIHTNDFNDIIGSMEDDEEEGIPFIVAAATAVSSDQIACSRTEGSSRRMRRPLSTL